ncbi:MAG: hypothetical protein FIA93_08630 [Deltaproteobacteria bacterium]|nr:hypothetical protein [Deltaproteobacteria bacterium]
MKRAVRTAAAIAGIALSAGVAPGAWAWPEAHLRCDNRANHWEENVTACPRDGAAYPGDGNWRDGVVVELVGFPYTEDTNGFPQTTLDHWWFTPDGRYVKGQKATIDPLDYPGKGTFLAVRRGGGFVGRLITQPATLLPPGRYKVLFQARIPCEHSPSAYCNARTRETPLPDEFKPASPQDVPASLYYDSAWSRSEFAWAEIEILPGKRPELDSSAFRLACPPSGGTCAGGSPFSFTTVAPSRQLGRGGCLKFRKDGDPLPVQPPLRDDKGNPVFGPKQFLLNGFGNMPGAGRWKAYFDCYGGPPLLLGEYLLAEGPKPPPPPPPVVPVTKFALSIKIKRKILPQNYNGPYPSFGAAEAYPGMELLLAVAQPQGWNLYTHGEAERYDILLDGEKLSWNYAYAWDTSVTLPAGLAAGRHRITLHAEHFTAGRKIEFEGSTDIQVTVMPVHPRLAMAGRVETGLEAAGAITPVHPAMEVESVEIADYDNAYDPIQASSAVAGDRIDIRFLIPVERVWMNSLGDSQPGTERQVPLRVSFRQRIGDSDWHRFHEKYTLGVGIVCRTEIRPLLFAGPANLPLRAGSAVTLKISGFPCGERISVLSEGEGGEKVDWGVVARVGPLGDGIASGVNGSGAIEVRGIEERVKPRKPQRLTFIVRGDSGREARQAITVAPTVYIEVTPKAPKAGQRLQVMPYGFKANTYANVFLGEAPLTPGYGKPLEAGQPVEVVLPEGVAGKQVVRLKDSAGNEAEETIQIEGRGADAVCTKPCVILPARARQGEPFDAILGGFLKNEQLVLRFDELFEVGNPYQRELMVKQPVPVPGDVRDGRYKVTATSMNDPARTAFAWIDIAGGYRAPTLSITCPGNQPGCRVPRFKPGESLNTTGFGWMPKGTFRGVLYPEQGQARTPAGMREGCVWGFVEGRPQGAPCDETKGEIRKYWELPADSRGGAWVIEVSDGASTARAGFLVEDAPAQAQKPPDKPIAAPPPVHQDKKICNPELPRLWQPGCVEPDKSSTGGQGPQPATRTICDPNRPRYAQPGCVESATPDKANAGPRTPEKCRPNVPSYAQSGCIP